MLTEKDYCDYDTCVALKDIGCDQHYDKYKETNSKGEFIFDWFTLYEAAKWLRENCNLHIEVCYNPSLSWYYYHLWNNQDEIAEGEAFPTYEDALKTAVYMAVEHLKNDNNGN